jgi:hypothetical protein
VVTVERATLATRATAETPPQPSSRASTPNNVRRCRSFNWGHNDSIRRPTASKVAALIATLQDYPAESYLPDLFIGGPLVSALHTGKTRNETSFDNYVDYESALATTLLNDNLH